MLKPGGCVEILWKIGLSQADQEKILYHNARHILNLHDPLVKKAAAE